MYQPSVREQIGVGREEGEIEPCASFSEIKQKDHKVTKKNQCRKISSMMLRHGTKHLAAAFHCLHLLSFFCIFRVFQQNNPSPANQSLNIK